MYRRWTQEEIELLEDKWGIWSVKRLAKHFNRTENAVILKSERLGLGGAYQQYLNTTQIGEMFGVHRRTVLNYWIQRYGLRASSARLRKQKIYRILIEDLVDWCYNNQDKWSSVNLEPHALGEEFDWLVEKRKADKQCTVNTGFWTMSEYSLLIKLSNEGVPLKEIASRLNRTYFSVRRKRQHYLDSLKEKRAV